MMTMIWWLTTSALISFSILNLLRERNLSNHFCQQMAEKGTDYKPIARKQADFDHVRLPGTLFTKISLLS